MYFKITNKDSDLYKRLRELREREIRIEESNLEKIKIKVELPFDGTFGHEGQQNWGRVTTYDGFCFTELDKVNPKVWKKHPEHDDVFVPNLRTKLGREMAVFLHSGMESSYYRSVLDILGIDHIRRFSFPYLEIANDILILYIDDRFCPFKEEENPDLIEITKREFEEIRYLDFLQKQEKAGSDEK